MYVDRTSTTLGLSARVSPCLSQPAEPDAQPAWRAWMLSNTHVDLVQTGSSRLSVHACLIVSIFRFCLLLALSQNWSQNETHTPQPHPTSCLSFFAVRRVQGYSSQEMWDQGKPKVHSLRSTRTAFPLSLVSSKFYVRGFSVNELDMMWVLSGVSHVEGDVCTDLDVLLKKATRLTYNQPGCYELFSNVVIWLGMSCFGVTFQQ